MAEGKRVCIIQVDGVKHAIEYSEEKQLTVQEAVTRVTQKLGRKTNGQFYVQVNTVADIFSYAEEHGLDEFDVTMATEADGEGGKITIDNSFTVKRK